MLKLLLAAGLLSSMGLATSALQKEVIAIRCPVSGQRIDKQHFLPYRAARVYFHSAKDLRTFQKDRDKYATKANAQLVASGQARQIACPITGRNVRPNLKREVGGVEVRFCCIGCLGRVAEAEPEIQLFLTFGNNGFAKGFTVGR